MAASTDRCTTSPKTITQSPITCSPLARHSNATGASATRGGRTALLGAVAIRAKANSSSSIGNGVALSFIWANCDQEPICRTNSPVARTLASVSFAPTDTKHNVGGSTPATVVKECGARFATPSALIVDTQAIARGMRLAVNHG